jgi:hypothetical protein
VLEDDDLTGQALSGKRPPDMLFAIGWVVVRSTREPYVALMKATSTEYDVDAEIRVDELVDRADEELFAALQAYLKKHDPPDLDWHFRPHLNNASGVLQFASSRNHRGEAPTALELLRWIAQHGPDSYGIVYLHDDEDQKSPRDMSNEYRVFRLLHGTIDEHDDPFLSPLVPNINRNELA